MANPIRRIIQLVLDRTSAQRTEDEAKRTLGGIEGGVGRLKGALKNMAAAFAAAFALTKLIQFGRESIRLAAEQEVRWRNLASTVDAVGESFADLEPQLRASAAAFQDATVWGDDEYAETLAKLTAMTGDLGAATQNMGLVANVAARYFDGQLAPAADLVGRVMNGNIGTLSRMGIVVKDAQEGLEVLAERSFGAASERAQTFSGRIAQINGLWGDFREEIGMAITENEEMDRALGVVKGALAAMAAWVQENQEALRRWVGFGIRVAVDGLDALIRTILGVSEVIVGSFRITLGLALRGLVLLADAVTVVTQRMAGMARVFGLTGIANSMQGFTDRVRDMTAAVKEWIDTSLIVGGVRQVRSGGGRFTRSLADGLETGVGDLGDTTPTMAGGAVTEDEAGGGRSKDKQRAKAAKQTAKELDGVRAAIEAHNERMRVSATLTDALGDSYDALRAEAGSLMTVMSQLAEEGIKATDDRMVAYADRLKQVQAAMAETSRGMEYGSEVADQFGEAIGAAMGAGIKPFAAQKARQNAIEAAELAVRALTSVFLGNPAGAAVFAKAAGQHAAIAAAWAALAGGGGSARVPGGGGGAALSGAREAGANGAANSRSQTQDVTIVLNGPGFHAMNPEVQRVVYGSMQEARERFGPNVRLSVVNR